MGQVAEETRSFLVHARHEGRNNAHRVEGKSFEEAAVAFVERWHPSVDADGDVSVLVSEDDSGSEHCFKVNLDDGDTHPCG